MNSDTVFDPDFPTKQSAGYLFVRLLFVQAIFIAFNIFLVLVGDESSIIPHLPILRISYLDILLILFGIVLNFALFLLVFAVWQSIEYRLSSEHLIFRKGLWSFGSESVVSFSSIERTAVRQSIIGRIFNYGNVEVMVNAGNSHRALKLNGVPFPHQFNAHLKAMMLSDRHYKKK